MMNQEGDFMVNESVNPSDTAEYRHDLEKFLRAISCRPGMYVGKPQLNLVEMFVSGWLSGRGRSTHWWDSVYDIEDWMFLKHSVSRCACNISGWHLLSHCFGTQDTALSQFEELVDDVAPAFTIKRNWSTISRQLSEIDFSSHTQSLPDENYTRFVRKHEDVFKLLNKRLSREQKSLLIVPIIEEIIREEHTDLAIYIHNYMYVRQIRFLYKTKDGWVDNTSLSHHPDYYEQLICLHAFAEQLICSQKDCIVTIMKQENEVTYNYQVCKRSKKTRADNDDYLFVKRFEQWKIEYLDNPPILHYCWKNKGIYSREDNQFDALIDQVLESNELTLPLTCTICDSPTIHAYIYDNADKTQFDGYVEIWCSHCKSFAGRIIETPTWWKNAPFVSEYSRRHVSLDKISDKIDRYFLKQRENK